MSSSIDKQWMKESARRTTRYVEGVQKCIEFVVENGGNKEIYSCPCTKCKNMKMKIKLDDIHYHLLRWGIVQSYTVWYFHGEESIEKQKQSVSQAIRTDESEHPRMEDLVNDTDRFHHFQPTSPLSDNGLGTVDLLKGRYMGQGNHIPDIASNEGGSGTPHGSVGRMPNNDFANSLNSFGLAHQKCEILNIDLEVIATASVCIDSTSSIIHGKPLSPTHEKLVVDNILLPEERTSKKNHPLAMTFREVGIGGYVCHPKSNIRYL